MAEAAGVGARQSRDAGSGRVSRQGRQTYAVAPAAELAEGSHRVVQVTGGELGIFYLGGTFYALPNRCIHQGGPLCRGRLSGTLVAGEETNWRPAWRYEGEVVACPWHSLEFHVPTGRCLAFPDVRLRHYETWVEHGQVYVRL